MVECCVRAHDKRLTAADLDWLLAERLRAEAFEATMFLLAQRPPHPI